MEETLVSNKSIFVRVTKNQHERIKNNAEAKGFKSVSAYVRSLTLEHDLSFERKFNELYTKVIAGELKGKNPNLAESSE